MKRYFIDIYRGSEVYAQGEIFEDTRFTGAVNNQNKVSAVIYSDVHIPLMLQDYIYVNAEKYYIKNFVELTRTETFAYSVTFFHDSYSLLSKPFLSESGQGIFKLFGTAEQILTKIVESMNTYDVNWTVGTVAETTLKEIQFVNENCRSALGKLFTAFGLEVSYTLKAINLTSKFETADDAIQLSYGPNNGLTSFKKRIDGDFFTRVIGFGSSENIPAGYRGGIGRLSFNPGYIDIPGAEEYGTPIAIEVTFDVKIERTGLITNVSEDLFTLEDSTIDFNLFDNIITGETPKIVLLNGNLAGEEFEIIPQSYNHANKTFKIKSNTGGGYTTPNSVRNIQEGDTYKFVGINLPQSYVDAAEDEVKTLTQNYANTQNELTVSYELEINPIDLMTKDLVGQIFLGRKINVFDEVSGTDATMRVVEVEYPLIYPELVRSKISDKVQYSEEEQIRKITIQAAKDLLVVKENIKEVTRFSNLRLEESMNMIFDPEGNYYTEKIKPLSVDTAKLRVATRPQDFTLSVNFKPNYAVSTFNWTSGKLSHNTVSPGETVIWNIEGGTITGLVGSTAYYIYARVNRSNDVGVIVLDTVARQIESDSTYYYFQIGTLSSYNGSNRRAFLNYGSTDIDGGFLTTGNIMSRDGYTGFDLDNGEIYGKIAFLNRDESAYLDILDLFDTAEEVKAKADLLKDWAFEDTVLEALKQETIIVGGLLKNTLIDTVYVRASIVNAAYVEGLDLNFVRGTIGGNVITSTGIVGDKFDITNGKLTAEEAEFENISVDGLNAVNAVIEGLTATDVEIIGSIKTADDATGSMLDSNGMYIYNGAYGGVVFSNDGQNHIGGSYINLDVDSINVKGSPHSGKTLTLVAGGYTLEFTKGLLTYFT